MKNIWCFIQARSNSSRFPNKIMADICGKQMIYRVYERCRSAIKNTAVLVPFGDPVIKYLRERNIIFYEGSENNVLDRYYECAMTYDAESIIRITADCPLIKPEDILMCKNVLESGVDFYSNLPNVDGYDVEGFSFRLLEYAVGYFTDEEEVEHVTLGMKNRRDELYFKIKDYKEIRNPDPVFCGVKKLSVDTKEDLEVVRNEFKKILEAYK